MRIGLNRRRMRGMRLWTCVVCAWLLAYAWAIAEEPKLRATLDGHIAFVWSVAFSPDGKMLASGATENDTKETLNITFWDVATGKNVSTLKVERPSSGEWCSLVFSPDGKTLASGCHGNRIMLWEVATGKGGFIQNKELQYERPDVVFSHNGKLLATGGRCIMDVEVWDVASGKNVATLKGNDPYGINGLAFTADGKTLVSLSVNDGLKLWDTSTWMNTATFKIAKGAQSAAFSPDGKILATGGANPVGGDEINLREINLWEVETGKQLNTLQGHTSDVLSLAFSSDGKTLASGSEDKSIRLWEVATGKKLATLEGHTDTVWTVAFSPDSKTLASGSKDGTVKLWDLPSSR